MRISYFLSLRFWISDNACDRNSSLALPPSMPQTRIASNSQLPIFETTSVPLLPDGCFGICFLTSKTGPQSVLDLLLNCLCCCESRQVQSVLSIEEIGGFGTNHLAGTVIHYSGADLTLIA